MSGLGLALTTESLGKAAQQQQKEGTTANPGSLLGNSVLELVPRTMDTGKAQRLRLLGMACGRLSNNSWMDCPLLIPFRQTPGLVPQRAWHLPGTRRTAPGGYRSSQQPRAEPPRSVQGRVGMSGQFYYLGSHSSEESLSRCHSRNPAPSPVSWSVFVTLA